jgi:hypothetical protein
VLDIAKYDHSADAEVSDEHRPLHVVFAVTDLATHDVILPSSVVADLQRTSHKSSCQCVDSILLPQCSLVTAAEQDSESLGKDDGKGEPTNVDLLNDDFQCTVTDSANRVDQTNDVVTPEDVDVLRVNSSRDVLREEQISDPTLKACRSMADQCRGGYFWRNGLLYHADRVLNCKVEQICVPQSRRKDVISLAHEKGFHQGHKKTGERIRYSFFWPSLRSDIIDYCASCTSCQQRRRLRTSDRVPIAPIERPGLPGDHLMMDIIGPIDPPSSQGHKYLLTVICLHSRWPFAYLLKNLSARAVCDCLCDAFSHLGVASVISSDCGTNFTSKLTQLFLERMGCSPRFNTPAHPEASGTVERFNQTFKRMLHHVITSHARQWHKYIPFVIWAVRESGNETTGPVHFALRSTTARSIVYS